MKPKRQQERKQQNYGSSRHTAGIKIKYNWDTPWGSEPGYISKIDYIRELSKHSLQGYSFNLLYKELQGEFDQAMNSIEKYGGFYIGRYETGNISSSIPIVSRLNTDISGQIWYDMYLRMKNISNNKNIQTSMIWGCLFDETMKWIMETGDKEQVEIVLDSASWGNYANSIYYRELIPTGSANRNISNNIYDIAGNVADGTLEGSGRRWRTWAIFPRWRLSKGICI